MPISTFEITDVNDENIFLARRQEEMENRNSFVIQSSIEAALAAGKTVRAKLEMNTNTILQLMIGDKTVIDKFKEQQQEVVIG